MGFCFFLRFEGVEVYLLVLSFACLAFPCRVICFLFVSLLACSFFEGVP